MTKKKSPGSREVEPFQVQNPRPVLQDSALYLGDGGRVFCGKHAGTSARYTGRDLSGQRVARVSGADRVRWEAEIGSSISCEDCATAGAPSASPEAPEIAPENLVLYRVQTLPDEPEVWRDRESRAYLADRSRLTEDIIDRVDGAYRAVVLFSRLTVLGFASDEDAERGVQSEIALWEVGRLVPVPEASVGEEVRAPDQGVGRLADEADEARKAVVEAARRLAPSLGRTTGTASRALVAAVDRLGAAEAEIRREILGVRS